jgi:hypothetical protein
MRPKCFQRTRIEHALIEDDLSRTTDAALDYTIEPISAKEAADFIRRYEYLGTPGRSWARYGARTKQGELAGVEIFGRPIPMADNEIVLERGGCTLWAQPHAASWLIPKVVTMAARDHGWTIFYAYADPAAGELGTIYQSCNWMYLGQGSPNRLIGGKPRLREYFTDGKVTITERRWRQMGYNVADADLLGWRRIMVPPKHRYAHVEVWATDERGRLRHDKRAERALRATFKPLPYP